MVLVFQIQDVAAHGGLIELRRIAADTRGQFAQIPRVIFLRGGGQTAQFEQLWPPTPEGRPPESSPAGRRCATPSPRCRAPSA